MATISQTTPAPDVVKPGQPQPTATTVLPAAAQEAQGAATAQPSRLVMLIVAMMKSKPHISDLIFSPGRLPQVEVDGQLVELTFPGINKLSAQDTEQIGRELIGDSEQILRRHYAAWIPGRQDRLSRILQDAFSDRSEDNLAAPR